MADSVPTVLHLLAPSPVGGLEAVVERLVRGQRIRGVDARIGAVVEPEARPHPFVQGVGRADILVEALEVPHRAYLSEMRALGDLLGRTDPDVAHTHGYRADVVAGTVARRAGFPTVSTVHGFTSGGWKNRFFEWLQIRSLRQFDAVVAVSRSLRGDLASADVPRDRTHVIPNAWDADSEPLERAEARRRLGLPLEAFVVGWVGRLSREKGADVLLRALPHVVGKQNGSAASSREASGALASLIGDGREDDMLRRLAAELGVAGAVRFHGRVPRAADLYRAFDVFVLSSRTEGTPISLFEAMEATVPVVATRVGGVPDVVSDDQALLVPPDDPAALGRAIGAVRRDRNAAEARARRARQRLREEFAVEPWLDRYEEVYRGVLARRAS